MPAILPKPDFNSLYSLNPSPKGRVIGESRQGRPLYAHLYGNGSFGISLIGGCHADEPTGPLLLRKLCTYLNGLKADSPLLTHLTWVIVPHANPDGEAINNRWWDPQLEETDLAENLSHAVRELPGDDLEFGFPQPQDISSLRVENQFIYDFWIKSNLNYKIHVSLHGMHQAYGPWFLLDKDFAQEALPLISHMQRLVKSKGYVLHDVNRNGEKGFYRLAEGFCSRPDGAAMRAHFKGLGDFDTANKFHASSMECIRIISPDCLTMVTEMPLFIVGGKSQTLTWPDPVLQSWSTQFNTWRLGLRNNSYSTSFVNEEAHKKGVRAMKLRHQMYFQWNYIWEGIMHQFAKI